MSHCIWPTMYKFFYCKIEIKPQGWLVHAMWSNGPLHQVGLDGARWIQIAREKCAQAEEDLGWDWSKSGNDLTYLVNLPKTVNCSYIESVIDSKVPDYSKALVLHPTLSTCPQEHTDDSF